MVFRKREKAHHLTKDEEFQVFKLVIDKFLWIGTIAMLYGVYLLLNKGSDIGLGIIVTLVGALILMIFTAVIAKDLNYKRD